MKGEIENLERLISEKESSIYSTRSGIRDLNNAKVALRIEFSNVTDPDLIRQKEEALRDIEASIQSRRSELNDVEAAHYALSTELRNARSAFTAMGCSAIRNI